MPSVTMLQLHQAYKEAIASMEGRFIRKQRSVGKLAVEKFAAAKFKISNNDVATMKLLKRQLSRRFFPIYLKKWIKANRMEGRFFEANAIWLETSFSLSPIEVLPGPARGEPSIIGRPKRPFADLSERSKRQRTEDMRKTYSASELSYAASMKYREERQEAVAKVIREASQVSPTRGVNLYKKIKEPQPNESQRTFTPEQVLAIQSKLDLSRNAVRFLNRATKAIQHNIFPWEKLIDAARCKTYPDDTEVSHNMCNVSLQSLIDHTANRLLRVLKLECGNYKLCVKYGFDGSSGQSQYKQTFEGTEDPKRQSDESVFVSSLVPVMLSREMKTVWKNPCPSSAAYCRPIRLIWEKETQDLIHREAKILEDQISNLHALEGENLRVEYDFRLTMVDGKICSTLMNSATTRCYICNLSMSNLNNLDLVSRKTENPAAFTFGISPLHCYIRFFEHVLHLAYRLPIRKWRINKRIGEGTKVEATKKTIQDAFWKKMGLLVDIPKQGFGTTNDGNTARRAFRDVDTFSEITGVEKELLERFRIILICLNCGSPIDSAKFKAYTWQTAEDYVELYNWYPMPPTIHKVLVHGSAIIEHHSIIPIGQLGEEAMEARHKHIKSYRRGLSRKMSRVHTNADVLNRLLSTSDPVIVSQYLTDRKSEDLPIEVEQLLVEEE